MTVARERRDKLLLRSIAPRTVSALLFPPLLEIQLVRRLLRARTTAVVQR